MVVVRPNPQAFVGNPKFPFLVHRAPIFYPIYLFVYSEPVIHNSSLYSLGDFP